MNEEQYIKTTASRTQYFSDAAMTIRHREDGPAVEYNDGEKAWYLNGKCHREDGPAVEDTDGYKEWYLNGKLHREDGPAIEYTNGYKAWYINDKSLTEEEFNTRMSPTIELTFIHINVNGTKHYYSDREMEIFHREDGPAIEYADGSKEWYINGERLTEKAFNTRMNPVELTLDEIAKKFGVSVDKLKIKK